MQHFCITDKQQLLMLAVQFGSGQTRCWQAKSRMHWLDWSQASKTIYQ